MALSGERGPIVVAHRDGDDEAHIEALAVQAAQQQRLLVIIRKGIADGP